MRKKYIILSLIISAAVIAAFVFLKNASKVDEKISALNSDTPKLHTTPGLAANVQVADVKNAGKSSVMKSKHIQEEEENSITYEERPDAPMLTGLEKEMFLKYLDSRNDTSSGAAARVRQEAAVESRYANGKITGTWEPKKTRSGWFGYRVDNSVFDSLHNVFYVVSYPGHLYKLEYLNGVKWTLLNHKIMMNPGDNGTANPVFYGTLLPDSTFRLIRSYDEQSRMEYSDDEGRTWKVSSGGAVNQSWANQAYEITNNGVKRIVLHTYYSNNHYIYFSDNNGQSYTSSKFTFPISTYDVRIVKPFFTNEMSLLVWNKSTKAVQMYKYNPTVKDFELKLTSTSTLAGTNLSNIAASYYNGKYHYYISTINTTYTVYYSADEGLTWVQKNAGRDKPFEIMVPEKPYMLISGFEDMKLSSDYGANWTGYGNTLGWDLQHLRTFEKSGGKHITLAGLDFGCYISETPDNKSSYKWCNDGASYALHYDAVSSENYNTVYMGNQDRGTTAYSDTGAEVNTVDVDGTDVLRVSTSKHEMGVWSWFYYGRIRHRYNFPTGNQTTAVYDGLGNWWAAPMLASPNPSEDAVYVATGNALQKFSYNESTNAITKTSHPFDFKVAFGDNIGGFGYSEVNRKLWYVALNNGVFLYSKDGGISWTKSLWTGSKPRANDQAYNYAKNQIVIKASENDTNKVYYAGVGNFLLMSANGGKTFALKSTGLNVYRIRDFVVTPDDKFIFAACGSNGAWIYSVDNNYWYQMYDSPVPTVDFTDVEFIKEKNIVRFATFGSGVLDFKLNQVFNTMAAPTNLTLKVEKNQNVRLNWDDNANNEKGYIIERATDSDFVTVDTIEANANTYLDTNIVFNKISYYTVKAYDSTMVSYKTKTTAISVSAKGIVSPSALKVQNVSSQEITGAYNPVKYAFDNNPATFWHTSWKNSMPKHPHFVSVDLGEETPVYGFRYLPRQDGSTNGYIANFTFYVTNDTTNWGNPVITGKFTSGTSWKESLAAAPASGRYAKLLTQSSVYGDNYTSAAEIAILYQIPVPDKPLNLYLGSSTDEAIYLRWTDNSINETGFLIEQLVDGQYVRVDTVKAGTSYYFHSGLLPATKYTYRVSAYNASGLSEYSNVLEATTKIKTAVPQLQANIRVYPNPFTSVIQLEFQPFPIATTAAVLDAGGKVLRTFEIPAGNGTAEYTLSELPKGVYFLKLTNAKGSLLKKILKE